MILALAVAGFSTVFSLFDDPTGPDVRMHPHLTDIGFPFGQQDICDTEHPEFGQVGTTLRLWIHKNRCQAPPPDIKILEPGAPVAVFVTTGFLATPTYDPAAGWTWIDASTTVAVLTTTAMPDGRAVVDLVIPDAPSLVGSVVYMQAVVIESDEVRESTGGRLEVQP